MLDKLFRRKAMLVSSATATALITGYLIFLSSPVSITNTVSLQAEGAVPDDGVASVTLFLEIDGEIITLLREVSGISAETQVIESKQGTDKKAVNVKLAGSTKYSNVVLKRGLNDDMALSDWFAKTASGSPEKKTVSIVIQDFAANKIAHYNFANAWPCKYEVSPFDAASDKPLIETVEICHERMTRVAP